MKLIDKHPIEVAALIVLALHQATLAGDFDSEEIADRIMRDIIGADGREAVKIALRMIKTINNECEIMKTDPAGFAELVLNRKGA